MDERTERMYELMRKESNRLKTFQMYPPWPKDYVDIKKLAKAGFFYAFNGDNVHCAFCRGQVCRWDRDDDPMTEHSRHFTTCPFIMGGEVGNEPIGEDPIPGPKRPRPYDVCGPYPNFPSNDPRSEQEQRNFLAHTDNNNQRNQLPELQHHTDPNAERLTSGALLPEDQHLVENQILTQTSDHHIMNQPVPPTSLTEPQEPTELTHPRSYLIQQHLRNQNYYIQQQQQQLVNLNNATTNIQSSDSQSNNLSGICKICYTNPIELVFLPCGHLVSCLSCAQRLHDCPFCRETITTRIRTYLV